MYPGADRYSLGKVKVRVAVIVPDCGSMARTVVTVVSMPSSAAAKIMPDMGAVDGSVAAAEEASALAAGVEGVEADPQALRASAVAVANMSVGRDLMDICHLVSGIVGWRTLQDSCELTNKSSSKK